MGATGETVTWKLAAAVFPEPSEALTLTMVVPFGKEVPEGGFTEGTKAELEASRAVTVKFTTAELLPVDTEMSEGTVMAGGVAPPRA